MGIAAAHTVGDGVRNDSDLARITADLAKARQRLAESESGEHIYGAATGIPSELAGKAHGANVRNLYTTIARLENEYLLAMLADGKWSPIAIIEAMQRPRADAPAPTPESPPPIISDATRDALTALLREHPDKFIPRSKLQEILK